MVNTVGFYQIAKLLIVPFTAVVQSLWLKESLSLPQMGCTAVVLCGVAIVYAFSCSAPFLVLPQRAGDIVAAICMCSVAAIRGWATAVAESRFSLLY